MKPTTISIHGKKAADPRQEGELQRQRTIMVVGATPRDPAAERARYVTITVTGSTPQQDVERNAVRVTFPIEQARIAMGISWMGMAELSQAIPPAYTQWIGAQLLRHLTVMATQARVEVRAQSDKGSVYIDDVTLTREGP